MSDLRVEKQMSTKIPPAMPAQKRFGNNGCRDQEWEHRFFSPRQYQSTTKTKRLPARIDVRHFASKDVKSNPDSQVSNSPTK